MNLCTSVSEEEGDGEGTCSEMSSLLCICMSEEVGDRDGAGEAGDTSNVLYSE
jgi:hypothetical protein